MNKLEELQEILCTVESVEKDLNQWHYSVSTVWTLNEWVKWINIHNNLRNFIEANSKEEALWIAIKDFKEWKSNRWHSFDFEVIHKIEHSLTLKHLMMYCNEKEIDLDYDSNWDLYNIDNSPVTVFNISKELHEQEDKVLQDIINFLKGYYD